jgi:hypothetical protein
MVLIVLTVELWVDAKEDSRTQGDVQKQVLGKPEKKKRRIASLLWCAL